MNCKQHQDCDECRLNLEIITRVRNLLPQQILEGMEKSGENIAVHVCRKGELLTIMTIKSIDVPEVLSIGDNFEAIYTEFLRDLKTGEALVMMTTHGSDHVGIYKLTPRRPLH